MRLWVVISVLALAGCSSSKEAEPVAEGTPVGEGGAIPGNIDFGKLVGKGGEAEGEAKGSAPQARVLRVRLTKIMDSQGWEQPVEIARLMIPSDWRSEGGANWDQKSIQCVPNIIKTYFRSDSPDGLSGIDIAPAEMWVSSPHPEVAPLLQQTAAQGGCPVRPPVDALTYLERTVVPRYRAGATVLDRQAEPEVAKAKMAMVAEAMRAARAQGAVRDVRIDSGSLHIAYQKNGQAVEEWLSTTVMNLVTPMPTLSGMQRGVMNDGSQTTTLAENVMAIRAPQGKFDNELAATIVTSIRPNPTYQAAVDKFQQNMNNIALKGVMDRARIWREASAEISKTINEAYRNQQAVQDRAAARFSQYIRGVTTYTNPATGQPVELTSGYSGVYAGPNGEYVFTNDPNYQPEGNFTRMNPVIN